MASLRAVSSCLAPVLSLCKDDAHSATCSNVARSKAGLGSQVLLTSATSLSNALPLHGLQASSHVHSSSLQSCRGRRNAVRCAAATGNKPTGTGQMLVFVPPHPLIKHWLAVMRNESTPGPMFKSALAELGRLLIYEASRDWLPTMEGQVQTPCGVADIEFVNPLEPIKVVPVLRAGLVLIEHISSVLPASQTFHLGFARDEDTLQPTMYLNKLPERFEEGDRVLLADPMLATGGTIVAAIEELKRRGADVKLMRLVAAVAAAPALKVLSEKFPGLKVYTGIIDSELNEKGYIVPGLGDAGDRSYGT